MLLLCKTYLSVMWSACLHSPLISHSLLILIPLSFHTRTPFIFTPFIFIPFIFTPFKITKQDNSTGSKAQSRTFTDLLQTPYDEDLFEYYATSQLVEVHVCCVLCKCMCVVFCASACMLCFMPVHVRSVVLA